MISSQLPVRSSQYQFGVGGGRSELERRLSHFCWELILRTGNCELTHLRTINEVCAVAVWPERQSVTRVSN